MRVLSVCAALVACAVAAQGPAWAAPPSVVVGNHVLLPNAPAQSFGLTVSGGNQIGGLDLNVEVADGGPANGGTAGPKFSLAAGGAFSGADLVNGTIFASNNSGQQNLTAQSQVYSGSISTSSGTLSAAGLIASPYVSAPYAIAGVTNYAAYIPSSRFTRTDWNQPGQQIAIPAYQRQTIVTPGVTTYHQPIYQAAPVYQYAHAPLVQQAYYQPQYLAQAPLVAAHAPLVAAGPVVSTSELTQTVEINKKK